MATARGGAKRLAHLLHLETKLDVLELIVQSAIVWLLWARAGLGAALLWSIAAGVLHGLRDASRST